MPIETSGEKSEVLLYTSKVEFRESEGLNRYKKATALVSRSALMQWLDLLAMVLCQPFELMGINRNLFAIESQKTLHATKVTRKTPP